MFNRIQFIKIQTSVWRVRVNIESHCFFNVCFWRWFSFTPLSIVDGQVRRQKGRHVTIFVHEGKRRLSDLEKTWRWTKSYFFLCFLWFYKLQMPQSCNVTYVQLQMVLQTVVNFYRSCIGIVSSEPPRKIFVPRCGQQIIPLGMNMLVSHNGKRCYGKFFFCLKGIYYRI